MSKQQDPATPRQEKKEGRFDNTKLTNDSKSVYYIDQVNTWSPDNKKCKEVQAFVREFRNMLISGDAAVDALMKELEQKVEELNQANPRTRRLVVKKAKTGFVCCYPEGVSGERYVFTFRIEKVARTYQAEKKEGMFDNTKLTNDSKFVTVMKAALEHGIDVHMGYYPEFLPSVHFYWEMPEMNYSKTVDIDIAPEVLQGIIEFITRRKGGNQ